jgi:hypothetical protein
MPSMKGLARSLCCVVAWLVCTSAVAQGIGTVEFARGVGFAQTAGENPRTLGKGLVLKEGDRLTTSAGGSAIVVLQDGTRMTVRPDSDLLIQQYRYQENAPSNSMVMQLLQGGFRAITGLISKGAPDASRVVTKTTTIGIRGTEFDARLCGADCRAESAAVSASPLPTVVHASAKLAVAQGEMFAVDGLGARRRLVAGGSVYPGDTVETAANASGVLVFRDDSRMTLGGQTRFRVDSFVFDQQNPQEGRFLVSLLRGSLRAFTGLVGKTNPRNVGFITATATIGIRGTGLDMDCPQDSQCDFFTWQGTVELTPNGQINAQVLEAGSGLSVSHQGVKPLPASTLERLPRPDRVPVNTQQLFTLSPLQEGQEGLYVYVRDGHIEVTTAQETLHLGRGETGFAGNDGRTTRPDYFPLFLEFDRMPMPNSQNPMLSTVLSETGVRPLNQCR